MIFFCWPACWLAGWPACRLLLLWLLLLLLVLALLFLGVVVVVGRLAGRPAGGCCGCCFGCCAGCCGCLLLRLVRPVAAPAAPRQPLVLVAGPVRRFSSIFAGFHRFLFELKLIYFKMIAFNEISSIFVDCGRCQHITGILALVSKYRCRTVNIRLVTSGWQLIQQCSGYSKMGWTQNWNKPNQRDFKDYMDLLLS